MSTSSHPDVDVERPTNCQFPFQLLARPVKFLYAPYSTVLYIPMAYPDTGAFAMARAYRLLVPCEQMIRGTYVKKGAGAPT